MPKYYISSGSMKQVVVADDHLSALKKAVLIELEESVSEDVGFGRIAVISEHGFDREDGYAPGDQFHFWTSEFFEELGLSVTFPKEE